MKALLPYLQLIRLPNVFTAMADIFMAYLVVQPALRPVPEFLLLLACSSCLYCAGMVLNDLFDLEADARLRPQRPLPSGRVSRRAAQRLAAGLIAAGLLAAFLAGLFSGVVALVLVGAILLYDHTLKGTPLGPVIMGSCRFLNVVLGMSTVSPVRLLQGATLPVPLLVSCALGVYVTGVTWFARHEAQRSAPRKLVAAALVINLALGALALLGTDASVRYPAYFWIMLVVAAWTIDRRLALAIQSPEPALVQAAVKTCLLSLIWLNAAIVCAIHNPRWALAVVALLVPSLVLGKWLYST